MAFMDTLQDVNNIGLEDISIGASLLLIAGINDQLTIIESEMDPMDEMLNDVRGRQHVPVSLERVDTSQNLHVGSSPSMIVDERDQLPPLSTWPAISVMAYRANPSGGNSSFDHGHSYADSLFVETVVKAGPEAGPPERRIEVCNKRIWRMLEAINRVLMADQTLGGMVNGLESPTAVISEAFARPEDDLGTQNLWFWQAGRIDYIVTKFYPF